MIWPIVIIVLVIAMALGPIMLMQPSRRDRRLAQLRQQAAVEGLHVRLADYAGKPVAVYSLPVELAKDISTWQLIKRPYSHGIHFHGQWELSSETATAISEKLRPGLIALLDELSDDVLGLELRSNMLGLWWNERPAGLSLDDIKGYLNRLNTMANSV